MSVNAQWFSWNLRLSPGQSEDSTHVLITEDSGNRAGRGEFVTLPAFAALIQEYLDGGVSGDYADSLDASNVTENTVQIRILSGSTPLDSITINTSGVPTTIDDLYIENDSLCILYTYFFEGSYRLATKCIHTSDLGDNWGAAVVNHDNTLTGNGTGASVLKVDTSQIATQYDISNLSDSDWYKGSTGTLIPTNTDTARREGVTWLDDAPLLQTRTSTGILHLVKPIQTSPKSSDWIFSMNGTDNAGSTRDNFTVGLGFNVGTSGGAHYPGLSGIGLSFEDHYEPTPGDSMAEYHTFFIDGTGAQHRLESYTIPKATPSAWENYYTLSKSYWKDPTNAGPWLNFQRGSTTVSQMALLGSASGTGATWSVDATATNTQIVPSGYAGTSRAFYINQWDYNYLTALTSYTAGGTYATRFRENAIGWNDNDTKLGINGFRFSDIEGCALKITNPADYADQYFHVTDAGAINMSKYTSAINSTGSATNILNTDASGNLRSDPVYEVIDTAVLATQYDLTQVTGGSSAPTAISPAQITSDQDNYSPAAIGIASYVYITADNIRAITGISDSIAGTLEKTIINKGSWTVYLPMDHPDSDAAHRFTGHSGDYKIYPGRSCKILYDLTSSKWRILDEENTEGKRGVFYDWTAGSTTAGDWGNITLGAINSGSNTANNSSTTLPGSNLLSTESLTTGGFRISSGKGLTNISAFASAHLFAETYISIPTLSDGTESFTVALQISETPGSSSLEPNNTIGIRYSHSISGGDWELFSQDNAAGESVDDLDVAVSAATLYKLRIEIDKAKSEARAYINGVYVGRVTGSLPNSVSCGARIILLKSAGTTPRTLNAHSLSAGAIYQ